MNLHRRPLFWFAAFYVCGIIFAAQVRLNVFTLLGLVLGALALVLVFRPKSLKFPTALVLCAVLALGYMRTVLYLQKPSDDVSFFADGEKVFVTGTVASDPDPLGDRTRFILRASAVERDGESRAVSGRMMVTLYNRGGGEAPFFGDTVRVEGRLRTPGAPTNPGEMDYREFLARKRIYCALYGYGEAESVREAPHTLRWLASSFKKGIISKSLTHMPPTQAWLMLGVLIGNYAALPPDVQTAFMRSGTMHLLAASGYNCAIIIFIFGFVLRRLTLSRAHTHLALIVLIWIFAMVAGLGPSIVRASIMVTLLLGAYLLSRAPDTVNLLMAAALVILGANPLGLYDVGFQLSFAAVLSIVLVLPLLESYIAPAFEARSDGKGVGRSARWLMAAARVIVGAMAVSAAAALGTWPITATYFNYVSVVSLAANALVAFLVVPLTACGILFLVLAAIHPALGNIAAFAVVWTGNVIIALVTSLGGLSWASVSVSPPSAAFVVVYYGCLLIMLEYVYRKAASKRKLPDTD